MFQGLDSILALPTREWLRWEHVSGIMRWLECKRRDAPKHCVFYNSTVTQNGIAKGLLRAYGSLWSTIHVDSAKPGFEL
jgi:hypothetical protein